MFNLSKHAEGNLGGALEGLEQATGDAAALVNPDEQTNISSEELGQGLTDDQAGAAADAARVAKWNQIVSKIGKMPPEVMSAIERMPEFQTWQPRVENASISAPETLVEESMQGAEIPFMGAEDLGDPAENAILLRANELRKRIKERQDQQDIWNQQAYQRAASFNLKQHKHAQMPMPEAPMQAPMPEAPMQAPMPEAPMPQMPQEQAERFPVENEGDFIAKFAEDLMAFNNEPGTQEYERARIAAEEIRDAVSPGFEEEANSIIESIMQLDVTQRNTASDYLIKLYEVMIPPMLTGDQAGSQMEPVMSEKNQDVVKGIVRYSLTESVLNNNKNVMIKTAADQFGQQYLLYGPTEKRICPKLRGKNLSVGDVVSEYTCRMHCEDGIVIDDNKTICGEALWRANAMDKQHSEYVDADGNIKGGYIEKRFEVNHNVPEENRRRLKPGETRKPMPAAWGSTESRLQDMRSKEGQSRDYRPETNTGDPFEWCHDSDQNNVEVSQAERDRREEATGSELVQYTNRDQGENNPKKAFNLKTFKTAVQHVDVRRPTGEHDKYREKNIVNLMKKNLPCEKCNKKPCDCDKTKKQAQALVDYRPMDTHQTAVNPAAAGLAGPSDIQSIKSPGVDGGKPMRKNKAKATAKAKAKAKANSSGFNLSQFNKEAEAEHPHEVALPDREYFRQNKPRDDHFPDVKPSKKKT